MSNKAVSKVYVPKPVPNSNLNHVEEERTVQDLATKVVDIKERIVQNTLMSSAPNAEGEVQAHVENLVGEGDAQKSYAAEGSKVVDYVLQELTDLEKQELLKEINARKEIEDDSESIETVFD